jgi:hypothetical protein
MHMFRTDETDENALDTDVAISIFRSSLVFTSICRD